MHSGSSNLRYSAVALILNRYFVHLFLTERNTRFSFIKHQVNKHIEAQIRHTLFCFLKNKFYKNVQPEI